MTDETSARALEGLVPKGTIPILELLERATRAGIDETQAMDAILELRRKGILSFDGRTVRRPPKPTKGARGPFDPNGTAGWFRSCLRRIAP